MKSIVFAFLALIMLALPARAQTYFPGSAWTSVGNLSAIEHVNVISITHAEQGIANRGAEAFAVAEYTTAGQRNPWEHRVIYGAGTRYTVSLPGGMVRVNAVYLQENRFTTVAGLDRNHLQVSVDAYFGWHQRPTPRISVRP